MPEAALEYRTTRTPFRLAAAAACHCRARTIGRDCPPAVGTRAHRPGAAGPATTTTSPPRREVGRRIIAERVSAIE